MTTADIQNRIAVVFGARDKAIAMLTAKGDTFSLNAAASLRSLAKVFEAWKQSAFKALAEGKEPGVNGWQGWINSGNLKLEQIAEISQMGNAGKLEALKETIKEAPATSARAITSAAKATGQFIADTSTGLMMPLLKPLGLAALGAGVIIFLISAGKSQLRK